MKNIMKNMKCIQKFDKNRRKEKDIPSRSIIQGQHKSVQLMLCDRLEVTINSRVCVL